MRIGEIAQRTEAHTLNVGISGSISNMDLQARFMQALPEPPRNSPRAPLSVILNKIKYEKGLGNSAVVRLSA